MPPLLDAPKDILAPEPLFVAALTVGVSGTSTTFVVPAEASLNLDPASPDALAFVIEQAGGKATNGEMDILDIQPTTIHQTTPLYIGSSQMIGEI